MISLRRRVSRLATAVTLTLLIPAPASAQNVRGAAGFQYENDSRFGHGADLESWLSSFRADHSSRFRQFELLTQFQISEQHFSGRPERSLLPQGTLRLAHPLFGLYGAYRPFESTDFRSVTSKRQEGMVSGYFQRPGLPQLSASWARTRLDPGNGTPASVGVTRAASARYDFGRLGLHADIGDEARDVGANRLRQSDRSHFDYGAATRFEGPKANATFQYDFSRARRNLGGGAIEITRLHTGGANASLRLSPKTSTGLGYNVRYSDGGRPGSSSLTDHEGSLSLTHQISRELQVATGGGVRSAQFGERRENEGYLLTSISADATARPGWRLNAGASHSLNWLPSEHARPIDLYRAGTTMRLASGLDLSGDVSLSSTRPAGEGADTLTLKRVTTLQTGVGVRAVPVRSFTLNASARRYRPGEAFQRESQSLTFWSANGDWRASNRFLLSGGWSLTDAASALKPDQTTLRVSTQWSPSRRLQASGSYNRISQRVGAAAAASAGPDRESYSGWVAMAVNRDLSARFQYNEIDPRLLTHSRQVVASVTQNFRR